MATEYQYFSGQGIVSAAPIVNGVVGQYRDLGDVSGLGIATAVTKVEKKESRSGQRATSKTVIKETKITGKMTLEELTAENLVMALRGTSTAVTAGTVTDEVISGTTLNVGDLYRLSGINPTSIVIKDSTSGTAKTLVAGTDYRITDNGAIELLIKTGFVGPLKASYTKAASVEIAAMQANVEGYALRFDGLNTADGDKKVVVQIPKVDIDPAKALDLIQDEFGKLDVDFTILSTPSAAPFTITMET